MPAVTSTRWNIIIKVVKEFWVFVLLYFPAIGLHPCRRLKRSLDKWQSIKYKKVCPHHILGINLITLAIKTLHMLTHNITFDVLKQQKKVTRGIVIERLQELLSNPLRVIYNQEFRHLCWKVLGSEEQLWQLTVLSSSVIFTITEKKLG